MQTIKAVICAILSFFQIGIFNLAAIGKTQTIGVNRFVENQVFEGFGTSSAWWSQTISEEETAREIARLLYDKETGLGLRIYRYNIGGGEADNPDCRIWDRTRRTESFYYFNEQTQKWEYDFSRDANAVRMMRLAVEYGADEVILFCNSPHYSMTASGHASGGLQEAQNNLPRENYDAFIDYVLTIADHFVSEGLPVAAISPINEPQWKWGGDWVGQEGCHFDPDECFELLEKFALEMKKRGCKYDLRAPESGQLTEDYYEYVDKFMNNETLRGYCDYYCGHSYWMDGNIAGKKTFGEKFKNEYPDKKFEMSEWCELPLKIDSKTIDSGIYMANVIVQDLSLMNPVSWSSWTAVNGDGLMEIIDGKLQIYNRYYAFMHFSRFIKPGAVRIDMMNNKEYSDIAHVAFKDGNKTIIVLVNNAEEERSFDFVGVLGKYEIFLSDSTHNCEKYADGNLFTGTTMPARSIETIVIG